MTADRAARALAVSILTVPGILLAHLLTTGRPAPAPSVLAVCAVVALVAGGAPPALATSGPRALAMLVAIAQLAGHALLALAPQAPGAGSTGCLDTVGRGAEIGLRVGVLQESDGCPPGTLGAGPAATAALAAVLAALAIIVGHALVAVIAATVLDAAGWLGHVAAGLGAGLAATLRAWRVAPGTPVPGRRPQPGRHRAPGIPPARRAPSPVGRRGPPLPAPG